MLKTNLSYLFEFLILLYFTFGIKALNLFHIFAKIPINNLSLLIFFVHAFQIFVEAIKKQRNLRL